MTRHIRAKIHAPALLAAALVTFGAAMAQASPGDVAAWPHPAIAIEAKLSPDPCAWDAAPAPPTLELTAFRPTTPSGEKGIACPIERHS